MELIIEIIFIIVLTIIIIINIYLRNLMKDLVNTKLDSNLSGFEIARNISSKYQNEELHIIKKNGKFLDHYNSERKVIKLSPEVFDGTDKYAFYVALNVALTTNSAKNSQCELLKITRFLVISSYIIIIIGSFINNSKIINLGFILFIISFIILLIKSYYFNYSEEEITEISNYIKEEKLINDFEIKYLNLLNLLNIGTLPYNFINYFR